MMGFELILLVACWIYILLQLLSLAMLMAYKTPQKAKLIPSSDYPFVSILVAARNEEACIKRCILSLHALNYPLDKYEILIGDDASEDKTAEIVKELQSQIANLKLISIQSQLGNARAKANVLAHLVRAAQSDLIFVTDADIKVKPDWILSLLPHLRDQTIGIVSNATMVSGETLFAKMQQIEWMLGFGNIIAFEQMGLKSTAVGNNMAFTKKAYFDAGTYESIPFSVTEDFQLFRYIRMAAYKGLTILQPDGLNLSEAQVSLKKLLHQRKRWMMGALDLPFIWKLIFLLQGCFFPMMLILFFVHFKIALTLFIIKVFLQSCFIWRIGFQLKETKILFYLPVFTIYQECMVLLMSIFYLIPIQMDWKDRKY
ncbi:MAG: glycosyltransferase [Bacteroidia bacterium]